MAKSAKNATSPKPSGTVEKSGAIPRHKLIAMGQHPETGAGTGKKTPA